MTTLPDMQAQFRSTAQHLGKLVDDLKAGVEVLPEDLRARLAHIHTELRALGHIDVELPPAMAPGPPQLACAHCVQAAVNAQAAGVPAAPVLPAATVVNGDSLCLQQHRIGSPAQVAAQQSGRLIVPGSGVPLPPEFPGL